MKILQLSILVLGMVFLMGCGADWHLERGAEALQKRQFDSAATHAEKVIRDQPKNVEALNLHAAASIARRDWERAEKQLVECLKLAPNYESARFNLGVAQFERGKFADAATTLKQFLEGKPKPVQAAEAAALLADCYERLGKTTEARDLYYKLVRDGKPASGRPQIYNKLGVMVAGQGKYQDAAEWFKASLRADSKYAPAELNLGRLHQFYLPSKSEAKPHYEKFISQTGSTPQRQHAQSLVTALDKSLKPAPLPVITKVTPPAKTTSPTTTTGTSQIQSTQPTQSSTVVTVPPVVRDRKKAEQLFATAYEEHKRGNLDKAIAGYELSVAADSSFADAQFNLGLILHGKGRGDDALKCYRRAIEADAKHYKAHLNCGLILSAQKRKRDAIAAFEVVLQLDPNNAVAHANLGSLYADPEISKNKEAARHYRRYMELNPGDPQIPAIRKWLESVEKTGGTTR